MSGPHRSFPKPGRNNIVDPALLQFIKETIGRCEWPLGCRVTQVDRLAAHHFSTRGMGGGSRSDDPLSVCVLCHQHHNIGPGEYAHHANWWNRQGRDRLRLHVLKTRTQLEWSALWAYMEHRGFAVPAFVPGLAPEPSDGF